MAEKKKAPPVVHLSYSRGELIVKEGDYGISIYKILKGNVQIFKKSGKDMISLATLGRGEVFGEMAFFNFLLEPRSASVEAIDDVELEVWHPARLIDEYKEMPPMLRYIVRQTLNRLLRMNRVIDESTSKIKQKGEQKAHPELGRRRYYRKKWDQECNYRPVGLSSEVDLCGVIKDISPLGLGVEVPDSNTFLFPHNPGSELEISFQLPSTENIREQALIRWVREIKNPSHLFMGLEFASISIDATKQIGFFMMA